MNLYIQKYKRADIRFGSNSGMKIGPRRPETGEGSRANNECICSPLNNCFHMPECAEVCKYGSPPTLSVGSSIVSRD